MRNANVRANADIERLTRTDRALDPFVSQEQSNADDNARHQRQEQQDVPESHARLPTTDI